MPISRIPISKAMTIPVWGSFWPSPGTWYKYILWHTPRYAYTIIHICTCTRGYIYIYIAYTERERERETGVYTLQDGHCTCSHLSHLNHRHLKKRSVGYLELDLSVMNIKVLQWVPTLATSCRKMLRNLPHGSRISVRKSAYIPHAPN